MTSMCAYADYESVMDVVVAAVEDDVNRELRQEIIRDVVDTFGVGREEVVADVDNQVESAL